MVCFGEKSAFAIECYLLPQNKYNYGYMRLWILNQPLGNRDVVGLIDFPAGVFRSIIDGALGLFESLLDELDSTKLVHTVECVVWEVSSDPSIDCGCFTDENNDDRYLCRANGR